MYESTKKASVIIPTCNRSSTLEKTIESYTSQSHQVLVIINGDQKKDNGYEFLGQYPNVEVIRDYSIKSAIEAKLKYISLVESEFILFGEDDAYLSGDYINKLISNFDPDTAIISGEIVYLNSDNQTYSLTNNLPYNHRILRINPNTNIVSVQLTLFTHAIYLTKKEFLENLKSCELSQFQSGNGFREESITQVEIANQNSKNVKVIPDCRVYHLNYSSTMLKTSRKGFFVRVFYVLRNNLIFTQRLYKYNMIDIKSVIVSMSYEVANLFLLPILRRIKL
jgi:glycosyltransferase involved in cell wall biosynthesis